MPVTHGATRGASLVALNKTHSRTVPPTVDSWGGGSLGRREEVSTNKASPKGAPHLTDHHHERIFTGQHGGLPRMRPNVEHKVLAIDIERQTGQGDLDDVIFSQLCVTAWANGSLLGGVPNCPLRWFPKPCGLGTRFLRAWRLETNSLEEQLDTD